MRTYKHFWALLFVPLMWACTGSHEKRQHSLIPAPVSLQWQKGQFQLTAETPLLYADAPLAFTAFYAHELLGWNDSGRPEPMAARNPGQEGTIELALLPVYDEEIGDEGFHLHVHPAGIRIAGNAASGVFYGVQALNQLIDGRTEALIPAMLITDYPRFAYRGLHLDVSRHFMPVEFIYRYIDYMAMHRLNVFHWHLIDDQGWRLEIKKHPRLTEVGAWRVPMHDVHWNNRPLVNDPENATYGGYYTQEQVRALVAYAAERNIQIMPEIEMPAHVMSALAAYPELSCTGENLGVPPGGVWPITHIYCAGKEDTFSLLEDVLLETIDLFPFEYIHIGGDEAHKTNWENCPKCQQRIRSEGLADEHELQSYFIKRIEAFLSAHGRKLMGWDEILEGGLAPGATVMSWRGEEGGIAAARMGHDAVMTPGSHCYFDHYQGDPDMEPLAIGGYTTLARVYAYEPIPEVLSQEEARHILGAQANVWTEYMPVPEHVEYMVFPRLAALSEVLWSPETHRRWGDFSRRMQFQYDRYDRLSINYSLSAFQVAVTPSLDAENRQLMLELSSEVFEPQIRYTLDGSDPHAGSSLYRRPVALKQSATLKAAVFHEGRSMQQVLSRDYYVHKGFARELTLTHPAHSRYQGRGDYGLVDGIRGSRNHADGSWSGFLGEDMVAVIDLGEATRIEGIELDALQAAGSWIFLPERVRFEVSADGEQFSLLDELSHSYSPYKSERFIHVFASSKPADNVRYLRVTAENPGECPPGHSGEGRPAFIFLSEIVVN